MAVRTVATQPRQRVPTVVVGAALVYVAMRLVSAVVIVLAQRHQPAFPWLSSTPYLGMTMHWDALWFQKIALHGYPHHLPLRWNGAVAQNQWAFLAGFPFATRAVMQLTGTGFATSATLLNLVAGVVAAGAIARLLEARIPRPATLGVVAVWAALPMAPTLQLAYSEPLAMALLSLALLWLVQEKWGRAGVAAVLLGLTRPVVPPLAVVFVVAAWRRWHHRADRPVPVSEWGRVAGGLGLTAAGVVVWPTIAWWWTGTPGAYATTEAAWHHRHLTPFLGLVPLETLTTAHDHYRWIRVMVLVALAIVLALTLLALRSPRLDLLLVTWCGAYLVYDLAVAKMVADELRMLLPLFPLVAVACGVASARLAPRWPLRVMVGVVLGVLGQYAWVMLFVRFLPGVAHAP